MRHAFLPDVRERDLRPMNEQKDNHGSQWGAIWSVAAKIGGKGETLRK